MGKSTDLLPRHMRQPPWRAAFSDPQTDALKRIASALERIADSMEPVPEPDEVQSRGTYEDFTRDTLKRVQQGIDAGVHSAVQARPWIDPTRDS